MESNTVLVVQFENEQRFVTCKSLEKKGFHTIGVRSINEALSILSCGIEGISMVLTEQSFPDYSGYVLKKKVEEFPKSRRVPVILLDSRVKSFIRQ